jgi:hypothetical protein
MTTREIIRELARSDGDDIYENLFAKVVSVDIPSKTCTVNTIADEMDLFDIRLIADSSDGVLFVPAVDSVVGICMINEVEGYVTLFSSLTSIKFSDGAHGGLIKITDLVTQLNNLESDVNDLKQVLSTTWTPVSNDGGAALKAAAATWAAATLTETLNADIENTTITHGDF